MTPAQVNLSEIIREVLPALTMVVAIATLVGVLTRRPPSDRRLIEPQPLAVQLSPDYVRKTECQAIHSDTSTRLARLEGQVSDLNSDLQEFKAAVLENGETRKNFIVERVDEIRRELSQSISKVHSRVDDISRALVDTLNRKT